MGSSVFHGAFSTFLAIIVLAPSKSYIFNSFFKMWFGIILYGVANGFILLPVLLACFGPLNTNLNTSEIQHRETEQDAKKEEAIEMEVQNLEGGSRVSKINQISTERQLKELNVWTLDQYHSKFIRTLSVFRNLNIKLNSFIYIL